MGSLRIHARTRGGPTQGWGNIHRLASVAERLGDALGGSVTFLAEGPPAVGAYLRRRDFEVVELDEELEPEAEQRLVARLPRPDLTLIEMLDVTLERQALHRERGGLLVVFDDLCDHRYDADLVVCGQGLPTYANRGLSSPSTDFLTGYPYFLARPQFEARAQVVPPVTERLEHVLVTLGGGRYDVGYLKAALAFDRFEERTGRRLTATFVLGHDAPAELGAELKARRPGSIVLGGVDDLDRLMVEHDLVVGSAGYTKLEAALAGRAQVMLCAQWHQLPLAATFSARTGVPDLGYLAYLEPEALAEALVALDPAGARIAQVAAAREIVDGRGFERVRAAIEARLGGSRPCTADVA